MSVLLAAFLFQPELPSLASARLGLGLPGMANWNFTENTGKALPEA